MTIKTDDETASMIVSEYKAGATVKALAAHYSKSTTTIAATLKRAGIGLGRDHGRVAFPPRTMSDSEHATLNARVRRMVERGEIPKKSECESCGATQADFTGNQLHAHHDDYNKPYEVRWLCNACHKNWHYVNQPIAPTSDTLQSIRTRLPQIRSRQQSPDGMKQCKLCEQRKPLEGFSPQPKSLYGKSPYCKQCSAAYQRMRTQRKKTA